MPITTRMGPMGVLYLLGTYHCVSNPTRIDGWIAGISVAVLFLGVTIWSCFASRGLKLQRKLMIGSFDDFNEGPIYALNEFDTTHAAAWMKKKSAETGVQVSLTSMVIKALAKCMANTPGNMIQGRLLWGHFYRHKTIDIGVVIMAPNGGLIPHRIANADKKTCVDISREIKERAERVRSLKDKDAVKREGLLTYMPSYLVNPIIKVMSFFSAQLGLQWGAIGVKAFPMGSVFVSNVGALEVGTADCHQTGVTGPALVPPTPWLNCALYFTVSRVHKKAWLVLDDSDSNGKIEARPIVNVSITGDHRLMDGYYGAFINHYMYSNVFFRPEYLDDPDLGHPTRGPWRRGKGDHPAALSYQAFKAEQEKKAEEKAVEVPIAESGASPSV